MGRSGPSVERARGGSKGGPPLRVAQVGVLPDPEEREPEAVLEAWFSLPDVARAVAEAGADVTVVQAGARDAELVRDGVRYRFVRVPVGSVARRALGLWAAPLTRRLVEAVAAARPDVIHFHSLSFPRHVRALTGRLPGVPLLLQDHKDGPPGPWLRPLFRRGLDGASGVAFTAAAMVEPFVRAGILGSDVAVFTVPESSSRFTPGDRESARVATGLHGDPCLLWLGNLDANKDPLTALEGIARAVETLPGLRLWCAFRHDPLRPEVEARVAADDRLRDRVRLLGPRPRDQIEALLRAADLLVQASHREGSGYAVLEALACGTPPVVTDIPAFRALTGDGAVGCLFPPGDAVALGRALAEAGRRVGPEARAAARRRFEDHLSFEVVGRKLLDAYRTIRAAAR